MTNKKTKKSNSRVDFKIRNQMAKSTRSQEEMVGFILIVVLVSVIGVILLVISLRKPVERIESNEITAFLEASMHYTTSCQPNPERVYDFQGLIIACRNNENCIDGNSSCN